MQSEPEHAHGSSDVFQVLTGRRGEALPPEFQLDDWLGHSKANLVDLTPARPPCDSSAARAAARVSAKQSSDASREQRPASSERSERRLVGRTVVDDLQRRPGQPDRLRQQCSIRIVAQPDFKLERQVIERSQDPPARRLSDGPSLHGTALGDRVVWCNSDGGEQEAQGFAEPLDEKSTISCRHHDGQQASLADSEHDLDPANADQVGIPGAEDCVRRCRLGLRCGVEPIKQFLGAAEDKHGGEACGGQALSIGAGERSLAAAQQAYVF